jgi:hypothetical protein
LRFIPHVLPVQVGTTVEFANSDPLAHNVFSISSAKRFNLGLYGRGAVRRVRFDRPGVVQVLCNVHQEMSAYIVVIPNPFFARTGRDGRFRIEGVPAGQHRLRCWHEELGERTHAVRVPANGTMTENFLMDRAGERDAASRESITCTAARADTTLRAYGSKPVCGKCSVRGAWAIAACADAIARESAWARMEFRFRHTCSW